MINMMSVRGSEIIGVVEVAVAMRRTIIKTDVFPDKTLIR
jgi:hypothetical protein